MNPITKIQNLISIVNKRPAFGCELKNRSFSGNKYRYGFNGMEKDDEVKGENNSYDFGARIYDNRIGRWLKIDPDYKSYIQISTYAFALNKPINLVDSDGGKIWDPVNDMEVIVSFDSEGIPSFKLSNGNEVSAEFLTSGGTIISSWGKTEAGREDIQTLIDMPTEVTLRKEARLHDANPSDLSSISPALDKNNEPLMTDDGFYEAVTIMVDQGNLEFSTERCNCEYNEVLTGVLSVEVGHLDPAQIEIERTWFPEMHFDPGITPEDSPAQVETKNNILAEKRQTAFANIYNSLLNEAIRKRISYREEKGIELSKSVFQPVLGMKGQLLKPGEVDAGSTDANKITLDASNKEKYKEVTGTDY